jgi:hypothetical protein
MPRRPARDAREFRVVVLETLSQPDGQLQRAHRRIDSSRLKKRG